MKFDTQTVRGQVLPLFIDGEWLDAGSGTYMPSLEPATGEEWYRFADCAPNDIDQAVSAAQNALDKPAWRDITQTQRADMVFELAKQIKEHATELALLEARDNGKILRETTAQISYLHDYYRYFAGIADKIEGSTIPVNKFQVLNYTKYEPLGVVAIVTPFNSPLNILSVSLAPCLAVGNTVVVKPSEHTSASTIAFCELIKEAGIPDGVFNVVTGTGRGAGKSLVSHSGISKVAFTGGTDTGRDIAMSAGQNLVQVSLELGGKSPQIIFADADLDRAVNGAIAGIFASGGQTCVAGSRIFVEESIYEEAVSALKGRALDVAVGHPEDPQTEMGPLATQDQLEKVKGFVKSAKDDGAKLICGGSRPQGSQYEGGWYFAPTLFSESRNDMHFCQEEIFGPVAGIIPFSSESDVLCQANETRFGLSAGVWTRDLDRAMRCVNAIDCGTVWVNTFRSAAMMSPMGGFKDSGYGKHNGFAAIQDFSRLKNVVVDYSGQKQDAFVVKLR
jgi:aldehyde dehydrogenase (NAD+)